MFLSAAAEQPDRSHAVEGNSPPATEECKAENSAIVSADRIADTSSQNDGAVASSTQMKASSTSSLANYRGGKIGFRSGPSKESQKRSGIVLSLIYHISI
jgi:hypothetical protein